MSGIQTNSNQQIDSNHRSSLKKEKIADFANISAIIAITALLSAQIVRTHYVFGSKLDWQSQHWPILDYLRMRFYDTWNFLPNLALHLGGGENIYNLSYYGLFSPYLLISFLFPHVPMPYYVMASSLLAFILSCVLLYFLLRKKNSPFISLICIMFFLLASPLLFHSHRHIMFVNYMPFLLLAFHGIDRYYMKRQKSLVVLGMFLMIMTSYFFSVSGMVALFIYFVFKYLENQETLHIRGFSHILFQYCSCAFLAVLMAAILLLPTAYVILFGRAETSISLNISQLIIPSFHPEYLLYGHYSMGLTAIFFYSLCYGLFSRKKELAFLAVLFLLIAVFPIGIFILNGTMYTEAKILIPFLPLATILISASLREMKEKKIYTILLLIPFFLVFLAARGKIDGYDFIIASVTILLFCISRYEPLLIILLIFPTSTNITKNGIDKLVTRASLSKRLEMNANNNLTDILDQDNDFFRVANLTNGSTEVNRVLNANYYLPTIYSSLSNNKYKDFYFNRIGNEVSNRNNAIISHVKNALFRTYMGVKYELSKKETSLTGYNLLKKTGNIFIYRNDNVFPLGYATNKLLGKATYEQLRWPYNVEALFFYTVVDHNTDTSFESILQKAAFPDSLAFSSNHGLEFSKENSIETIIADTKNSLTIPLSKDYHDTLFLLDFKMHYSQECRLGDSLISINHVSNKLTCREWKYHNQNYQFNYVISQPELSDLLFTFKKGKYMISNISAYTLDYEEVIRKVHDIDRFSVDKKKTKGDHIEGSINVSNNSYFVLSLPYAKGYTIKVNDRKVSYELVDNAFIGFPIDKGLYDIKIDFRAPFQQISQYLSLLGLLAFLAMVIVEKKQENN